MSKKNFDWPDVPETNLQRDFLSMFDSQVVDIPPLEDTNDMNNAHGPTSLELNEDDISSFEPRKSTDNLLVTIESRTKEMHDQLSLFYRDFRAFRASFNKGGEEEKEGEGGSEIIVKLSDFAKTYKELETLKKVTDSIQEQLPYFDIPPFKPPRPDQLEEEPVLKYLTRLEDTILYFRTNHVFDREKYLRKYTVELQKVYGSMRDYVGRKIQNAANYVREKAKDGEEKLETLNVHFKLFMMESECRSFILQLKDKKDKVYFLDIFHKYYSARYSLTYASLRSCVQGMFKPTDEKGGDTTNINDTVISFIKKSLDLLVTVLTQERQMFQHFFFKGSQGKFEKGEEEEEEESEESDAKKKEEEEEDTTNIDPLFSIQPLCNTYAVIFYENLRYVLLKYPKISYNIGVLCNIISSIRPYISHDEELDIVLKKMIKDLEETIYVKSIEFAQQEIRFMTDEEFVIECCSKLLNKLYSTRISKRLFEEIVQETIINSTQSLIRISQKSMGNKRKKQKGEEVEKMSSEISMQLKPLLFLLKNLLSLREMISKFNVSFIKTEIELNFSHISDGILNFLRGKSTLQIKSIVFDIFINSQPKVLYKKISTKKNLDHEIKTVCENLILNITQFVFGRIVQIVHHHGDEEKGKTEAINQREVHETCIKNISKTLTETKEWISNYLSQFEEMKNELLRTTFVNLVKIYKQYFEIIEKVRDINCTPDVSQIEIIIKSDLEII